MSLGQRGLSLGQPGGLSLGQPALSLGQLELRAAEDLPELPAEWRGQPVLCLPDGRSRIGAEAVIRALPGAVCGALVTRSRGKARHPQT